MCCTEELTHVLQLTKTFEGAQQSRHVSNSFHDEIRNHNPRHSTSACTEHNILAHPSRTAARRNSCGPAAHLGLELSQAKMFGFNNRNRRGRQDHRSFDAYMMLLLFNLLQQIYQLDRKPPVTIVIIAGKASSTDKQHQRYWYYQW